MGDDYTRSRLFDNIKKYLGDHPEVSAEQMQTQKEFSERLAKMGVLFDEQMARTHEIMSDCDKNLVNAVIMNNAHVLVASFVRDIIYKVTGMPTGPKGIETFLMLTAHQAYSDFEDQMKERESGPLQ